MSVSVSSVAFGDLRVVAALSVALMVGACKPTPISAPEPAVADVQTDTEAPKPEPVPEPVPDPGPERHAQLDDVALFFAGMPLPEGSALAKHTQDARYQAYSARINQAWDKYDVETRQKILTWTRAELADIEPGPVFYPFSGPDILNAVTILPQGTQYTMLGLEPAGAVPKLHDLDTNGVMARVKQVELALEHILGRNYFITTSMKEAMDEQQGVADIMLFFLVRTGHEIIDMRLIELNEAGEAVEPGTTGDSPTPGIEVSFRVRGETGVESSKVARFFPGNAADDHFTKYRGLAKHLENQGELISMAKAASYLLFYPAFDDVRAVVLDRSKAVVTDSSGLPFHYVETERWDVTLYGSYYKPIPEYIDRCQPNLDRALTARSKGKLPFHFGYNFQTRDHLIVARRKTAITDPGYDRSNAKGDNTRCKEGKLITDKVDFD
ncbi:MAG: hypothetical protein ACI9MC_002295 [Kiritimatiellia bacterium]|jgi:hypothetical protein